MRTSYQRKNTRTAWSNEEKRQNLVIDVFHLIYEMPQHNMKSKLIITVGKGVASSDLQLTKSQMKNLEKNMFLLQTNNCKQAFTSTQEPPKVIYFFFSPSHSWIKWTSKTTPPPPKKRAFFFGRGYVFLR